MELEADNRGITEVLEKKSLDLDLPATNSLKENRHPKKVSDVKIFIKFSCGANTPKDIANYIITCHSNPLLSYRPFSSFKMTVLY